MTAFRIMAPAHRFGRMLCLAAVLSGVFSQVRAADDPYAAHIAPTDPLPPEQEREKLHVPPGFDIELVAAEPDIRKPMNMAFDDRGRLWVTESTEYPFPPKDLSKSKDCVKILEDTDGDGRVDKVTRFAEHLSIPIGVLPVSDGAIVFSIPKLYKLTDTDGDDRADRQDELYGTFGQADTHGLINALRWGFDGWIYVNHGFANTSEVKGADGQSIKMNSGNIFRIREDGSRCEYYTHGQVNPFGSCFDPLGNLYTADCHSKPIYMLLRGAWYPSFGKPHDGLGFGPVMCKHDHGSTAIAGVTYYAADHFPPAYRDTVFIGNVVTTRVNFDRLEPHGSTPVAVEQPDFIRSDDPWFRPVDIRLGPDGALYIADFYNKVIGHYEVPLTHPARDRERGRIWRVVYRGTNGAPRPKAPRADWTKATVPELIEDMGHPNLVVRTKATNQLVQRIGPAAVEPVRAAVTKTPNAFRRTHGIWVLERLGALDDERLTAAAQDQDRLVRVHAQRILSERKEWNSQAKALVLAGLRDEDGFVQRAAAEAVGLHPRTAFLRPLLDLRRRVPKADTQLLHTVRIALRNQFRLAESWEWLAANGRSDGDTKLVVDVATGLDTAESSVFLLDHIRRNVGQNGSFSTDHVRHIARYLPEGRLETLFVLAKGGESAKIDRQISLLEAFHGGLQQRGAKLTDGWKAWGETLAGRLLEDGDAGKVKRGLGLVASMRLDRHRSRLRALAASRSGDEGVRKSACDALVRLDAKANIPLLAGILGDAAETHAMREHAARLLGGIRKPAATEFLGTLLRSVPERLAVRIAEELARHKEGKDRLLDEIEAGKASAHLLTVRGVREHMDRSTIPGLKERIEELVGDMPPVEERLRKLIAQRKEGFTKAKADAQRGAKVFEKTCAPCHLIGEVGKKIGPELIGIGIRGVDRLLEDTLVPSRNVDQAFRATALLLEGDVVRTGLLQDDEGEAFVLADSTGNLIRYPKDEVIDWRTENLSPMPSNIAEDLPEPELYDLLAFLLEQRQPTETPSTRQSAVHPATGKSHY